MIKKVECGVPEDLIRLAVIEATKRSVYHPLMVSNFIIENIDKISIETLTLIADHVIISIAEGQIPELDLITWDKLYDEIQKKMEEHNVSKKV